MMLIPLLVLILSVQNGSAIIYRLNESEHARMPPVFHLDHHERCIYADNGTGVYCVAYFDLVTDEPSDLYNLITEYSAKWETHYNHSKLMYGVCLTRTCSHFHRHIETRDRAHLLEACLNETFWEEYKLKTRVTDYSCHTFEKDLHLNAFDRVVAVLIGVLLMLNLVGTLYYSFIGEENDKNDTGFLSCFAISRNWRRLVSPAGEGPDPRLNNLVAFNGLKAISVILIIISHTFFTAMMITDNTHFIEQMSYNWISSKILTGASMLQQLLFFLSSFLVFYNIQIYAETHKITRVMLLKAILLRWLRFTPAYLVTLALMGSWMRHFGSGPLWQTAVKIELTPCCRDWWINLLYINNFVVSECILQSWFLATDFQLFLIGMMVYVLTAGRKRNFFLALLFAVGILASAGHTYFQDLDGTQLVTPEIARTRGKNDRNFHQLYIRTHTNLSAYIAGIAVALLIHYLQNIGFKAPKHIGFRFLFWATIPVKVIIVQMATIFYRDGPRLSLYTRTMYAALHKLFGAATIAFLAIGIVFKLEDTVRGFLEWRGWTVPSRLAYSVMLVHTIIITIVFGTRTTPIHMSGLHVLEPMSSIVLLSFLAALLLHLLVEAPFYQLMKLWSSGKENVSKEKPEKNGKIKRIADNGKVKMN